MTDGIFSTRENEVIDLLLQGKSNKQIAAALGVSSRTVEFHLSNIYAKLGVASRTEAVLKLSAGDLRESTGAPAPVELRDSAVEKTGESADNGGVQIQLRRQSMKTFVRLSLAGVLLTAVVVAWALISRARGQNVGPGEPATQVVGENVATETLPYQTLGPATIAREGMLFEATGFIHCNSLTFYIDATFPPGFSEQFPNNEIPPMYTDLQLTGSSDGVTLKFEGFGGGGAGGQNGDFDTLSHGTSFSISPQVVEGQSVEIHAEVTFSDYVGIPVPVPFEIYVVAGECNPPAYQYVDGGTITTPGGVTVVVTPSLTLTEFMISVDASGPMSLLGPDPVNSPVSAFADLQVEFPDQTLAFDMEPFAGGGSGPGDLENFHLNRVRGYRVLSPLAVGAAIPVTIWVTFDPVYNLPEPVPFSFDLRVLP